MKIANQPFSKWPNFSTKEIEAVSKVMLSGRVNYWTGEECKKFEKEFAIFSNTKFAIALANGTVALDVALKALNIGPGDEVLVTSRTFIATVSSIVNAGAKPIFTDVDQNTQNITIKTIQNALTNKTKAIVCVHLAGWPCDMDPLIEFAKNHDLKIIEDCAQAHGAKYKGRPVGSLGDVGCWSFCQDKIMSTGGEGGMVTTNNEELWSKMWSFKDHGKNWNKVNKKNKSPGFQWIHDSFGTNWRMTELQGVIGRIQLKQLHEWNKKRLNYAKQIWDVSNETNHLFAPKLNCEGCTGTCDGESGCVHAAYKCYVFFDGTEQKRDRFLKKIISRGVPCFTGTCSEVYLERAFEGTGLLPPNRLPIAKKLGESSLMFLCHPTLTQAEIDKTCDEIKKVSKLI